MKDLERLRPLLIAMAMLLAAGVYAKSLSNGFVYDDHLEVEDNRWVRDVKYIPEIFSSSDWSFEGSASNFYRPTLHLSFLLVYQAFGFEAWAFHLQSVMFHVLNVLMVFLVTRTIVKAWDKDRSQARPDMVAFFSALLFAVHPMNSEAVLWVSAISELHFSFFSLLSIYFFLRKKGTASVLSVVFFFLASLSKETAAIIPALFMSYDYAVKREPLVPVGPWLSRYWPYAAAGSVYLAIRFFSLGGLAPRTPIYQLDWAGYAANVFPLAFSYLRELVLPAGLSVLHAFKPLDSPLEATVVLSATAVGVLALLMLRSMRRNGLLFFLLLWMTLPLVPVILTFHQREFPFAERYLYFPSMAFAVLLSLGAWRFLNKYRPACIAAMAAVVLAYSLATIKQIPVWQSDFTLWANAAERSPDNFYAHYSLGVEYMKQGRHEEAVKEYIKSLELKPDFHNTLYNMGLAYYGMGLFDKSISSYRDALAFARNKNELSSTHTNLGNSYARTGRFEEAIDSYEMALEALPDNRTAAENMETVRDMMQGRAM